MNVEFCFGMLSISVASHQMVACVAGVIGEGDGEKGT